MLPESDDWPILLLSLKVALVSTLAILPVGIALAWTMSRGRRPLQVALESALTLPLVLPPTAVGIVLLLLLGKTGPLGRAFDALGIEIVFTWRAAALASAVMALPLLVRSTRTAFDGVDPKLMGIARTLGDGPFRAFWRVVLPLSWRGIFAGTLLAFCRALGEFGATILIAGNIPGRTQTLALAIFQRTQSGRDHDALRLVAMTSAIALVAVYATQFWERHRESTLSS